MKNIKVKVYQQEHYGAMFVTEENEKKGVRFMLDYTLYGKLIEKENFEEFYRHVTTVEVDCTGRDTSNEDEFRDGVMESVFCYLNSEEGMRAKEPINYSLSVLDILEIDGEKYQVMGCGFKKLDY